MSLKNKKPIIMLCYARSGGTLLNKILVSLPKTVVLSEVNPLGGGWGSLKEDSYTTPMEQAKNWYNIKLESNDFVESIEEINNYCYSNEKQLIIRDWSFINFSPYKQNNYNPPNNFLLIEKLKHLNPKVFGFVRNGIDVWISRNLNNINKFSKAYLNYVQKLSQLNVPIFKYEGLTSNPEKYIRKICKNLKLEFSKNYKNFYKVQNVNGDTQIDKKQEKKIHKTRRKIINPFNVLRIRNCNKLCQANKILGYDCNYFDDKLMSRSDYFLRILNFQ